MQVVKNAWVAFGKVYALWEEHRSVAMGVECEYACVQLLGCAEVVGFVYKPFEQLLTFFFQPFWVPLNT